MKILPPAMAAGLLAVAPMAAAAGSTDLELDASKACPTVVRVWFADRAELAAIASWVEPWEVDHGAGWLLVGLDDAGLSWLEASGQPFEIDAERTAEICTPPLVSKTQQAGIPGFSCYRTVEETYAAAELLAAQRPRLVEWIDIGDSWEKQYGGPGDGFDLRVLKLTNRDTAGTGTAADPESKPILFVTASIHAREYAPAELVTRFAEELVRGYGRDPDVTWILDEHEIQLVMMANPDGRTRAEQGIYWRKNANNDECPDQVRRGVDLNRNFEHDWGCCGGSSPTACSEIYRGPGPASEPETLAYENWMRSIFPQQWSPTPPEDSTGVFLDIHSYGRLVMWPWGATDDLAPNAAGLERVGRRFAYFNNYQPTQSVGLYPTDGTTDDFGYGSLGVPSFGIEIGYRFFEPCSVFTNNVLEDNLRMLRYAARIARAPYELAAGPDVTEVWLEPSATVHAGDPAQVVATVTDEQSRGFGSGEGPSTIVAAEAWIDTPPWRHSGAVVVPMRFTDGVGDTATEELEAELATSGLDAGRHTIYVRAQDVTGAWGPVRAVFLWVDSASVPPRRSIGRVQ